MKTKEQFVAQANAIWNGIYDYTKSEYQGSKRPITIYCPKHDYHFTVSMAQNHVINPKHKLKPTGCPYCNRENASPYNHSYPPEEAARRKKEKEERERQRKNRQIRQQFSAGKKAAIEAERQAKRKAKQELMSKWQAKTIEEAQFKERVIQMYGDQYDTALVDYKGREKPVTLICRHHGIFEITPRMLLCGSKGRKPHGCWYCEGKQPPQPKMTAKEFNEKMRRMYGVKGLTFPIKRKITTSTKITATCAKHGEITHDAQWWLDGKGCEYCNGKFYPPDWKEYARNVHGDKYKYFGEAPRIGQDLIHYICPKHGEITQRYDVHVSQGCGCPKCANYPNKKTPLQRCNEWIAKCIEKYGENRYDYSRAHEDYVNNDSLVWIRCCIHDHWFQQTPDNNLRTVNGSCPICSLIFRESEGEATIRRWLQAHGILDFEQEHQLPNEDPTLPLQYLSADFYMLHGRDYIIIEFHGQQHYEEIPYFYEGQKVRTFAVQQHRDRYLRKYCRDHKIRLIEIPYTDFDRIDEILTEELLDN